MGSQAQIVSIGQKNTGLLQGGSLTNQGMFLKLLVSALFGFSRGTPLAGEQISL